MSSNSFGESGPFYLEKIFPDLVDFNFLFKIDVPAPFAARMIFYFKVT